MVVTAAAVAALAPVVAAAAVKEERGEVAAAAAATAASAASAAAGKVRVHLQRGYLVRESSLRRRPLAAPRKGLFPKLLFNPRCCRGAAAGSMLGCQCACPLIVPPGTIYVPRYFHHWKALYF